MSGYITQDEFNKTPTNKSITDDNDSVNGQNDNKCIEQLYYFKTSITEIIFNENTTKQQIASQQDSVIRVKNRNKYINDNIEAEQDENEYMMETVYPLRYGAFKSNPNTTFNDEAMMYYWLNYTKTMHFMSGLSTLIHGYIRQYFHDKYQDVVKLIIFKYSCIDILTLIKLSLNTINWDNLKTVQSPSTNNNPTKQSVVISHEAMNEFCCMALKTDNLIQIGDKEWVLMVHIIDDDGYCDIGVSFKYNDKSQHIFVATAIYLDKTAIELKHKLIGLKHNYCTNIVPFSLREIKFIDDYEIMKMKQDDNDDNMDNISGMECPSDWKSV